MNIYRKYFGGLLPVIWIVVGFIATNLLVKIGIPFVIGFLILVLPMQVILVSNLIRWILSMAKKMSGLKAEENSDMNEVNLNKEKINYYNASNLTENSSITFDNINDIVYSDLPCNIHHKN